ncbi:MAG: hypothetical protein IJB41_06285 [Clostridia bacterium]|nr:hypothetical protein [Clostridia bacterium]
MRCDPTCPIFIYDTEIMRDDRGHAQAYLHAHGPAGATALLVEGIVRWHDPVSGASTENEFSLLPSNTGGRVTIPASESNVPETARISAWFTRVELADGSIWTGGAETLRQYPEIPALSGRMANALCAAAGRDAVCCAWEIETGDWQCVCGRWNDSTAETCLHCARDRSDIMEQFSPEAVEQLAPVSAPLDIEDPVTEFQPHEQPAPEKGVRMKRILAAVFAAAVFATLALAVRAMRYEAYDSSGLMPTSQSVEQSDI